MYHRIAEERFDPWGLAVSPANFADQLAWIAQKRTALPLPELVRLNSEGRLPRTAIALTFDDGYACVINSALPLLEKFEIPATLFISASLVERDGEFWWDELERIVFQYPEPTIAIDGEEMIIGESDPRDRNWRYDEEPKTSRQRAYRELWTRLQRMAPANRDLVMEQFRRQTPPFAAPRESHRALRPTEIHSNSSPLLEYGSHAVTHSSLPALPKEEKTSEIGNSMDRLAELTGKRPRSFAYPYGDFDDESVLLVEKAGFDCACTTEGGFISRRSRTFALPRIWVGDWESQRLARLLGAA